MRLEIYSSWSYDIWKCYIEENKFCVKVLTGLTGLLSHLTFCRNSNIPLWQPLSSILYFVPENAKNVTFTIQPWQCVVYTDGGQKIFHQNKLPVLPRRGDVKKEFPDNWLIINWWEHSWRLGQVGMDGEGDDKAKFESNVTPVQVPQLVEQGQKNCETDFLRV